MLGFGGGSDNEQRFWNFVLLKAPCTDEELAYVMGTVVVIFALAGVVFGLYQLITWLAG